MVDFNRLVEYAELLSRGYTEARSRLIQSLNEKEKIISIIKNQDSIHSDYSLRLIDIVSKEIILIERVNRWIDKSDQNVALQFLSDNINEIKKLGLEVDLNKIIQMNVDEKRLIVSFYDNLKLQLNVLENARNSNSSIFLKEYIALVSDEKKLFEKFIEGDQQAKKIISRFPRLNFLKIAAVFAIFMSTAVYSESSELMKYYNPVAPPGQQKVLNPNNNINMVLNNQKTNNQRLNVSNNTQNKVPLEKPIVGSPSPEVSNSLQKMSDNSSAKFAPSSPKVSNSLQKMSDTSSVMHVGVYSLIAVCLGVAAYVVFNRIRERRADKKDSDFIDKLNS